MDTPSNPYKVAWFSLGPKPGDLGSAVLAGHFDTSFSLPAAFSNLHLLKPGDKIYTQDNLGSTFTFVVTKTSTYNPGYAEEVFTLRDKPHLNLITCYGSWDQTKNTYTKRLVVFSDLIPTNTQDLD